MSRYVAMRTRVKVKPEYFKLVDDFTEEKTWEELSLEYPFLEPFVKHERAEFVVEAPDMFTPEEWESDANVVSGGDKYRFEDTRPYWGILGCVNYGHEVFELFRDIVLSEIAEEIYFFEMKSEDE